MIAVLFVISKDPERVWGTEKSLGEAAVPNATSPGCLRMNSELACPLERGTRVCASPKRNLPRLPPNEFGVSLPPPEGDRRVCDSPKATSPGCASE